jgi:hypothetical protein
VVIGKKGIQTQLIYLPRLFTVMYTIALIFHRPFHSKTVLLDEPTSGMVSNALGRIKVNIENFVD